MEKSSTNMATSRTEKIGYTVIRITTVKPPHYRFNDLKALIHSVVRTYQPNITEPINVQYHDMNRQTIPTKLFTEISMKVP